MPRAPTKPSAPASVDELVPGLIDDLLAHGTRVRLAVGGVSMVPTLRDRDLVTIEPLQGKVSRFGDLVLFRREDGAPVLHRVVRRWRSRLQTRGDANIRLDPSIDTACVLGRVRHIERAGSRSIDLESAAERIRAVVIGAVSLLCSALYYKLRSLAGAGWPASVAPEK